MTRKEAIECLNYQNEKFFGGQSEALKMAVLALSASDFGAEEAYCRGKIDGIKECTARLKKMNEEFAKGGEE